MNIIEGRGETCLSKFLKIRIDIETRDPLRKNPFLCLEWDSKNVGMLCANDGLHFLVALGSSSFWYKSCYLDSCEDGREEKGISPD